MIRGEVYNMKAQIISIMIKYSDKSQAYTEFSETDSVRIIAEITKTRFERIEWTTREKTA